MTQVRDHFDSDTEFEDLLSTAEDEARTGREQDFVADIRLAWETHGRKAFMSEAQASWLRRIAKE